MSLRARPRRTLKVSLSLIWLLFHRALDLRGVCIFCEDSLSRKFPHFLVFIRKILNIYQFCLLLTETGEVKISGHDSVKNYLKFVFNMTFARSVVCLSVRLSVCLLIHSVQDNPPACYSDWLLMLIWVKNKVDRTDVHHKVWFRVRY